MKKAKATVAISRKPKAMKKAKAMKSYGKRRSRKTKGRKSKSRGGQAAQGELCTMLLDCLDSASESESEHGLGLSNFNSIQSSDETSDDTSPCTEDGGAFPETGNGAATSCNRPMAKLHDLVAESGNHGTQKST